jgi:TetR/AcrR family acrAB operon transcriptional repressor
MVRKTREASMVTREAVLDAAERVFRARGVTRTSLAEVAAEAGVTRGAVYWHFRDKADLFGAMCERATSPLDALIDRASGSAGIDPLATLSELCVGALTRLGADDRARRVFEIMFHRSELVGELAPVADRHQHDCGNVKATVRALLRQAVARGQLPPDTDTALSMQALHAYMTGLMHEWVLDPAAYDLTAAAPALIDTFIAGLRLRPPLRRPMRNHATRAAREHAAD